MGQRTQQVLIQSTHPRPLLLKTLAGLTQGGGIHPSQILPTTLKAHHHAKSGFLSVRGNPDIYPWF